MSARLAIERPNLNAQVPRGLNRNGIGRTGSIRNTYLQQPPGRRMVRLCGWNGKAGKQKETDGSSNQPSHRLPLLGVGVPVLKHPRILSESAAADKRRVIVPPPKEERVCPFASAGTLREHRTEEAAVGNPIPIPQSSLAFANRRPGSFQGGIGWRTHCLARPSSRSGHRSQSR